MKTVVMFLSPIVVDQGEHCTKPKAPIAANDGLSAPLGAPAFRAILVDAQILKSGRHLWADVNRGHDRNRSRRIKVTVPSLRCEKAPQAIAAAQREV